MRLTWQMLPAVLWGGLIIVLSLLSPAQMPKVAVWSFDKLAHVGVYFIFCLLLLYGMHSGTASYDKKKHYFSVLTLLIASILGISMEVLQYVGQAGRTFEMLDILANIIGNFAGIAVYSMFH